MSNSEAFDRPPPPQNSSNGALSFSHASRPAELDTTLVARNAELQQQVEHLTQALADSEARRQLAEDRLNDILSNPHAAIISLHICKDRSRQYDYCSLGCETVYGYTPQEFLADTELWQSRVFPEDWETKMAAVTQSVFAAEPIELEYRFRHKDGTLRWIREVITSRYDQVRDGWIVTILATDISEQQRMVTELHQSCDYIQRITNDSPQLLYIFDLVNQCNVYVSRQISAVLGYEPEEIDRQGSAFFIDRWHPDDLETIQQAIVHLSTVPDGVFVELKYRMRHKDGSWRWLQSRDVVFERDAMGRPTKVLGTAIDITRQILLEEGLRRSEARYQAAEAKLSDILNRAVVSIACYRMFADYTWEYEYHSAGCETVFGFNAAEMTQGVWWTRIPPEDQQRVILPVQENLLAGQTVRVEYRFWHKDGSLRWISSTCTAQRDETQNCWHVIAVDTDITDRKQAELALQESEACNRAILEAMPDLLLRVTPDGTCLDCILPQNPDTAATFIPVTTLGEILPPEVLPLELEAIQQAIATRKLQTFELELVKKGKLAFEEVRIVAIDRSNEALLIVRDINARKQAELALQHQLEKEQALSRVIQTVRNSLDLNTIFSTAVTEVANFLQVDQVGIVQYLPQRNLWLTVAEHLSHAEVASLRGVEIPDRNNRVTERLKRLEVVRINDTRQLNFYDPINQELAQTHPGAWLIVPLYFGTRVWGGLGLMQCRSYIWQDAEVELVLEMSAQIAIAIQQSELYQQVTQFNLNLEHQVQQRTAELQQALEFEALLKRITDKVRDSLDENQILAVVVEELALLPDVRYCNTALYNPAQQTVTVNHTADPHHYCNLSDSDSEPVLPPVEFPEIYTQFQQGLSFQFCSSTPKLNQDWVMALGCPIVDNQTVLGDLLLIKERDAVFNELEIRLIRQVANQCAIALRQSRLYQAVQSHAEELESLNRLKDEFLNTVSHELRSPMANIKMATQMLEIALNSASGLNSRSQQYFQILKEECDRETNLINDLLDLSRLESGRIELSLTAIDLQYWIPHVAEVFEERARHQYQELLYHFATNLPPLVTDPFYLQRILSELLHNACKYTPRNQQIIVVVELADIRETNKQEKNTMPIYFKINITNTGITIPKQEHDRVFEKFYRIPDNDPWKHGGTGLGLALVKKLVGCLGGTIQLESAADQTTFTLLLPCH